jgi:hypothetical protein
MNLMPQTQGIDFVVSEAKGCAHVVLRDTSKGLVRVEQSMMFCSQEEFDAWCEQERRRVEYPHVYDQLSRSVNKIFNDEY